jgi:hypothetical protein
LADWQAEWLAECEAGLLSGQLLFLTCSSDSLTLCLFLTLKLSLTIRDCGCRDVNGHTRTHAIPATVEKHTNAMEVGRAKSSTAKASTETRAKCFDDFHYSLLLSVHD